MNTVIQKFDRCFSQLKKVNLILTVLSFLVVIYLFIILPQRIPIQLSPTIFFSGNTFQIGNYGSKVTLFLLPFVGGVFTFLFGQSGLMTAYGKYSEKTFLLQVILTVTSLVLWWGIGSYLVFLCL